MPLKLNVGLTKKVGLPNYGSVGASCHVELELEQALLYDPHGWQPRLEQAFSACREAVRQELERELTRSEPSNLTGSQTAGYGPLADGSGDNCQQPENGVGRPVTQRQLRAIESIALRRRLDLLELLESRFGKYHLQSLTRTEASRLIEEIGSQNSTNEVSSLFPADCREEPLTMKP